MNYYGSFEETKDEPPLFYISILWITKLSFAITQGHDKSSVPQQLYHCNKIYKGDCFNIRGFDF